MKKRIYLSLVCSSVLAVLLSFVLLIWVYFDLFANQVKKDLVIEAQIMAQSTTFAAAGDTGYLQALQGQFTDFRITLIDPAGTVLFDSAENVQNLGNHKDRPEVQQALTEGQGEAVRYSTTLDADTYYYAKRLPDGNILRVARQTDSIGAVFFNLSPLFLLILVVLLFACLLLASILTRKIFRPLTALADRIEHAEPFDYDEELAPFVDKIRHQNQLIQEQLAKLQEERDTVVAITEKMPEGLVLMDKEKMILSVNESAVSLFHAAKGVYQGHHLLNLSRNVQLNRCVDEALAGSGGDVILLLGARYCHVFASPVYSEGSMLGAIIFMMDVTKEQTAAQARRDFSANVSHELKTPLTAISGFAEMIEQGMVQDPADVRHFAKKIFDEAKRL